MKKGLKVGIGIATLSFMLVACAGSSGSSSDESTSSNTETTVEEETNKTLTKGDTFEKDDLKFTVNDLVIDYQTDNVYYLEEMGEDQMLIQANFTFENTGDNDEWVSIYDFKCYADDAACDQVYLDTDGAPDGSLSAGRTATFSVYFMVPRSSQKIELEYESNIWTDEKVIVQVM